MQDEYVVVVEIPAGSRNKYEMDSATGRIFLDRRLFTSARYPTEYGYFPDTLAEDGDPLDALVILPEPTFPGCHIRVRPIGVFWMEDEKGPDGKVVCVPSRDSSYDRVRVIDDLQPGHLAEIEHFFQIYKDLEPEKRSATGGWGTVEDACRAIEEAQRRFGG